VEDIGVDSNDSRGDFDVPRGGVFGTVSVEDRGGVAGRGVRSVVVACGGDALGDRSVVVASGGGGRVAVREDVGSGRVE